MKAKKFVPKACKGDDATFEGYIELKLPTFDQKMDYLESMSVELNSEGGIEVGSTTSQLKKIRNLVKISKEHYVSVSLKNKETGEELNSFDDLSSYPDAYGILIEVAGYLLQGFKVGNA